MTAPIEITTVSDWNSHLRSSTAAGKTVIVDFHAVWCGPCKAIAPKYTALAEQNPHVTFLRVDVDNMRAIATKYQISSMPSFLAFKAGKVVETLKGADPAGLTRLVLKNAGPNPPVAPLPVEAEAAKVAGNTLFQAKLYPAAIEKYTEALSHAPNSATLFSNRSLAYLLNNDAQSALKDAERCTEISPDWGKGFVRLGDALKATDEKGAALKALETAVLKSEGTVRKEAEQKIADIKAS